ncbi:MAG: Cytochrome c biogenesis protein Ccs1 [Phycisphaerae bacterium]|nr:Cytochrome c biogenesis protein Ccs1 [Phycisphaerae bacterium]
MSRHPVARLLRPLASLKMTVVLMALSMLLIFAGTLAQIDNGIWWVQRHYFNCLWLIWDVPGVSWLKVPLPGGYALGGLMFVNLLAAHTLRFRLSWRRSGIILLHAGIVLLLVGQFATSLSQVETQMVIPVGGSSNYSEDPRHMELAVIDPTPIDHLVVVAIPQSKLTEGATVADGRLPFTVKVEKWFANAELHRAGGGTAAVADRGVGRQLVAVAQAVVPGTSSGRDCPAAYVKLTGAKGTDLGIWLLFWRPDLRDMPTAQPQQVEVDGRPYLISLRPRRYYHPYRIYLDRFIHEDYPGTNRPKWYESQVRLVDKTGNVDRKVRIYMNNPLRYAGQTFYQASFLAGDSGTILQVVRNRYWLIPYVSCVMVGLGLLIHFALSLTRFASRRTEDRP